MSAAKRRPLQRIASAAAIDRLQRAFAQLKEASESPRLDGFGVGLEGFVSALRSIPSGSSELRRRGTLPATLSDLDPRYRESRGKAVRRLEKLRSLNALPEVRIRGRGRVGLHPILLYLLSPSLESPGRPADVETASMKLKAVASWDKLPQGVVRPLRDWRDACNAIVAECGSLEAEGCYWLLLACPDSADRKSQDERRGWIALLEDSRLSAHLRKSVIAAAESLVVFASSSGSSDLESRQRGGRPLKWDGLNAFYENALKRKSGTTMKEAAQQFMRLHPGKYDSVDKMIVGLIQHRKPKPAKKPKKQTHSRCREASQCKNPGVKTEK